MSNVIAGVVVPPHVLAVPDSCPHSLSAHGIRAAPMHRTLMLLARNGSLSILRDACLHSYMLHRLKLNGVVLASATL